MKKTILPRIILMLAAIQALTAGLAYAEGHTLKAGEYGNRQMRLESKFYGVIEKLPANLVGTWVVSGRKIIVTGDTKIEEESGHIKVGAHVEVEGYNDLKNFTATEIEVDDNEFYGKVEKLPKGMVGTWIVSGRQITVSNETRIVTKGRPLKVGSIVKMEGKSQGNAFAAWKINVKEDKR